MDAADASRDLRALHDLRGRIEAAENAGDAETIVGLLAGDAVIMVPSFAVREGREACAAFVREQLPATFEHFDRRIAYTSAEVLVQGAFAFDRGTFAFTATPRAGGDTTQASGKYLWLYSLGADGWKLARIIAALDEEDDEEACDAQPLGS